MSNEYDYDRNRRVTVVFTDLEDQEDGHGLGNQDRYAHWVTTQLEGLRDIKVVGVKVEDTKTVTKVYEKGAV